MRTLLRLRAASILLFLAWLLPIGLPAEPLTVDQAVSSTLANSGQLKIKLLDLTRTQAAVGEAQARLYPQVSFTGSSTYMTNPPKGITITQGSLGYLPSPNSSFPQSFPAEDMVLVKNPEHTYFKGTGSLDQVLFTWGKVLKAIEVSQLSVEIAGSDVRATKRDQAQAVRSAYFGSVLARESSALLLRMETLSQQIAADRQSGFEQGTMTRLDVLQAKSQASQVASARVKAEEGLNSGLAALEYFTGNKPQATDLVSAFRGLPELNEDDLMRQALETSPELSKLGLQARQALLGEQISRSSQLFLPDLALSFGMDTTGQKIPYVGGNWTDSWSTNFTFSLGMKVQLFDGFSSFHKLEEATAQRQMAEAGLVELRKGLALQIRRALEAVRTQDAEVKRLRDKLAAATEQNSSAQSAYENEAATREEARGATAGQLQAELELLTARFQLESNLQDLDSLTGAAATP
ncbi:MAG: TolC family protein [Spirochaetales bacterium]